LDLSDVTIVILSRGREEVLSRTLKYWSKFDIAVLVLHNSENPINTHELSSNITYIVKKLNYGERCGEVSNYLTTEYAILSSDDELYLPSALLEMRELLKNHSSIVSVGGLTIAVGKYGPMNTAVPCYTNMRDYSNFGENSFERLSNHFNENCGYRNGAIYRLMRKGLMIDLMNTFSTLSLISTPYIYEVTGEIIINALGKSVYLPNIYWIRNWINQPVGHRTWDRKLYFSTWVSDRKYEREFNLWGQQLRNIVNLNQEEYSDIFRKILQLRKSSEEYERERLSRRSIPIPDFIKFLVRKLFAPNSLPPRIERTIYTMQAQGAKLNRIELLTAIESIA
jgi:glycosyltransferase domain-containing protein